MPVESPHGQWQAIAAWDTHGAPLLAAAAGAGGGGDAGAAGVLSLSPVAVALAAALIVVQALVSLKYHLGLHTQLAIAAVRCVVQLSVLGYVLVPIFSYNRIWLVLMYCCFMVWVSAVEAIGRPSKTFRGLFLNTLVIVAGASSVIMAYALVVVMRVQPWWTPQYLIPILGMVLGNTITGISVGLGTIIEELSAGADRVEKLLALGATRWEATRAPVARAIKLAMTPLLNQMSVVGLVSIPGMMTGQILAGTDPSEAARYQMVIMFLLGAAATMGAVASIYAAVLHLVDGCHRLRSDRLLPKDKTTLFAKLGGWLQAAWGWLLRTLCCCFLKPDGAAEAGYERLPGGADGGAAAGAGGGASAAAGAAGAPPAAGADGLSFEPELPSALQPPPAIAAAPAAAEQAPVPQAPAQQGTGGKRRGGGGGKRGAGPKGGGAPGPDQV